MLLFGSGGVMVEIYNDVALRRCPITRPEAQAMIAEVKGARLLLPAFLDPNRRVERDDRRDYGETSFRLYGRVAGRLFVIAYTRRGTVTRIISARKANARERDRYGAD